MLPGWSGVLLGTGTVLIGPILPKRSLKSRSVGGRVSNGRASLPTSQPGRRPLPALSPVSYYNLASQAIPAMLSATDLDAVRAIAAEAGDAIMEVYSGAFSVRRKDDSSPLTAADLAAHRIITYGLRAEFPDVPVLSEEQSNLAPWQIRRRWERYFLVDPLDGTKEFVQRNGQFTVNIAFVEGGRPTAGVVHAPAPELTYWGRAGGGACKESAEDGVQSIACEPVPNRGKLRVIGSRSHSSPATEEFVERLRSRFEEIAFLAVGSSIKICMVAEGAADLYPRLAPTMEWDTAAAHAVLTAAGGRLVDHSTGRELMYNYKEDLRNRWFVAHGPGWQHETR